MDEPMLSRRAFVRRAVMVGLAGTVAAAAVSRLGPIHGPPAASPGPVRLQVPDGEGVGPPMRLADLEGDAVVARKGEWSGWPVMVLKVKAATLAASARVRGYETGRFAVVHPDEPGHRLLGYLNKCTHLGCQLGWNHELGDSGDVEDYDGDGHRSGRFLCPCHQSQFDAFDLGRNLPGVPAKHPLDIVRIGLDGQEVIAFGRLEQEQYRDADTASL